MSLITHAPEPFAKTTINERTGHYDNLLTGMSEQIMQEQDGFVAGKVFPSLAVQTRSDIYARYPREWFLRSGFKLRAPGTVAPTVTYEAKFDRTYFCNVYASRVAMDNQTRANVSPPINLQQDAVELLTQHALIFKDVAWCAAFFATGVWGQEQAGVASGPTGTQFLRWDVAASTPIETVDAARDSFRERTGLEANKLVMGRRVWTALKNHPDIISRITYNFSSSGASPVMVTRQTVAALFGVDEIVIAAAVHDTGNEGATLSSAFIAGKHALLLHTPDRVNTKMPLSGLTFSWTGYNSGVNNLGVGMRQYYNEEKEIWFTEAQMGFDMRISSNELGHFFLNAVS